MDPTDFIYKTAQLLSSVEEEESHIRSSISRSYYGLFLYLREFLESEGVRLPDRKKKSHHQFILECIHEARFFQSNSGVKREPNKTGKVKDITIFGIYRRLQTLLQNRTDADYKLRITFHPNDSKDNLLLAMGAVQDFNGLDLGRKNRIIDVARTMSQLFTN
jgi:hypothetical protein